MHRTHLLLALVALLAACGSNLPPDSECTRGTAESDLAIGAWQGPGVTADGGLPDLPDVVASTTFLALDTDPQAAQLFQQLFADIRTDLQTREGLIAYKVGTSSRCNTARTLSVWTDESLMFTFAGASAHAKAVSKIGQLSRGNSAVTHWHDRSTNVTFETAFGKIGAASAPF